MKDMYCCDRMENEGWRLELKNNKIIIHEEYSSHYIDNAVYCPWCGKNVNKTINNQTK